MIRSNDVSSYSAAAVRTNEKGSKGDIAAFSMGHKPKT